MKPLPKEELLGRWTEKGAVILVNAKVERIEPGRLVYLDGEGGEQFLAVDTVVMAVGGRPNRRLGEEMEGKVAEIYYVGDCDRPGYGGMAIRSGTAIGRSI